jgi:hypothetical protein
MLVNCSVAARSSEGRHGRGLTVARDAFSPRRGLLREQPPGMNSGEKVQGGTP